LKFCCILPVLNGTKKVEQTINSLLHQKSVLDGSDTLRIIVRDGGSSDGISSLIERFNDPRIEFHSESDTGMYDALAKGLELADGDVCCYLPAGEVYEHAAFSTLSEVFSSMDDVHWVTGRPVGRNAKQQTIVTYLPHPYKRRFISCGMYGTRLTAIQQESTFWRIDLNQLINLDALRNCRLAGDYLLWKSFAEVHDLFVVDSLLASFTFEDGQLSKIEPGAYRREIRALRERPGVMERLHALLLRQYTKRAPPSRRSRNSIRFDLKSKSWKRY